MRPPSAREAAFVRAGITAHLKRTALAVEVPPRAAADDEPRHDIVGSCRSSSHEVEVEASAALWVSVRKSAARDPVGRPATTTAPGGAPSVVRIQDASAASTLVHQQVRRHANVLERTDGVIVDFHTSVPLKRVEPDANIAIAARRVGAPREHYGARSRSARVSGVFVPGRIEPVVLDREISVTYRGGVRAGNRGKDVKECAVAKP